jgi:hypothetical protein
MFVLFVAPVIKANFHLCEYVFTYNWIASYLLFFYSYSIRKPTFAHPKFDSYILTPTEYGVFVCRDSINYNNSDVIYERPTQTTINSKFQRG